MSERFPTASEFAASAYNPAVEKGFFARIVLANGTFKTTAAHRMDDLNLAALPYIQAFGERPVRIKDVAISSGISTQEWHDSLVAAGVEVQLIGTDISAEALHLPGRFADVLLDQELRVIHLSLNGGAIHPRVLKLLRPAGLNLLARVLIVLGARPRPFRLVSKAAGDIAIVNENLENCRPGQSFHVIRAANILNLDYFDPRRLRKMVAGLLASLVEGGLFIACRTHLDESNHATVFRYSDSRLTVLKRLGAGSELEGILL